MKYLLLIGDGMADYPLKEQNNKTPLMLAKTPNLDFLAKNGLLGRSKNIPKGMPPGSDVAISSLMGYNPQGQITGRGPLEAASQNIHLEKDDFAFRMNLISLDVKNGDFIMQDHSSGNISTQDSAILIKYLEDNNFFKNKQKLYTGISYRHVLVWPKFQELELPSIPPHDFLAQSVKHLIEDPKLKTIMEYTKASWQLLNEHPINIARVKNNLPPANAVWLWGQGRVPVMKSYQERWNISGATISAVDLIRGLGHYAKLENIIVKGATGWLDTNYQAKVKAAIDAFKRHDYVVLHIEAPDEASHQGSLELKIKAIEDFDEKVVGPMLKAMPQFGNFRILAACDHYTLLSTRTHAADPIPFIIYSSSNEEQFPKSSLTYNEENAAQTGVFIDDGANLNEMLIGPSKN